MIAMRDEEVFTMVVMLLTVFGIVWLSLRHKLRSERLQTIRKALEAGHIDERTRRSLLDLLAADLQQSQAMWRSFTTNAGHVLRRLLFVAGWLTFTIGGVVLVAMLLFGASRSDLQGASIATAIGFGLVSLPMAIRELDARRAVRG